MYKDANKLTVREGYEWALAAATAAEHGSGSSNTHVPAAYQAAYDAGYNYGTAVLKPMKRNTH
jgi:hypothetical protein